MPVSPETYAAFVAATLVLLVMPGPTVVMVVTQALAHGRQVAAASAFGVGLGDLCAASLSLAGIGALLEASATLFTVLKLAGAAWLVWIGVKMWRARPVLPDAAFAGPAGAAPDRGRLFRDAFLVTLLNPKGILFFVAFVPQFVDPAAPFLPQAAVFVLTFSALGVVNALGYVWLAGGARRLARRPGVLLWTTRAGGTLLVLAGLAAAFTRRTAG